jgi:hypothetical protein
MGAAVKNIELIRAETCAHIMLVHHVGLAEDAQTRPRGNSALSAAADICVLVTKTKNGRVDLTVTVERDGLEDKKIEASLASFETGVDDKGEAATVPYLMGSHEPADDIAGPCTFPKAADRKPTAAERKALVALAKAIKKHGILIVDDAAGFPDGVTTVSTGEWRDAYEALDERDDHDARRKAFKRAVKATTENGFVNTRGDRVWPSE